MPVDFMIAEVTIGVRILDTNLGPIAFKFFAHHHGVRSHDALALFRLCNTDGRDVVGCNDDPRVDFVTDNGVEPGALADLVQGPRGRNEPDSKATTDDARHYEKLAAIGLRLLFYRAFHGTFPSGG